MKKLILIIINFVGYIEQSIRMFHVTVGEIKIPKTQECNFLVVCTCLLLQDTPNGPVDVLQFDTWQFLHMLFNTGHPEVITSPPTTPCKILL